MKTPIISKFRQGELEECIASDSIFICPATFPLKKIRQTPSCDVEILLNKNIKPNKCEIKIMELQDTYWKALTTPGNWIYSTTEKEIVRLNCRHTTKQFEINNSGIISVQQGCKIRARTATMSHPAYQTTTFAQHFIPTNNLSILELYKPIQREYKINFTEAAREIWITNHNNIEASFNDIIEKARQIKEKKLQNSRFITYSAATCSIGLLVTSKPRGPLR
ncbi:hypothetical protein P5V15_001377 [Pogonomyrmex californicus]